MIRVMVVEDEPPILRQIVKLIEEYADNFKVTATAGNGKKALELLAGETVDLVFSDIKMPVVDGLELAEQIRLKYPNTIVVIISGYQDFQFARKAIQFHVYEYLLKPATKESIGKILSQAEEDIELRRNKEKKEKVLNTLNSTGKALSYEESNVVYDTRYAIFLICAGAFPLIPDDSMLTAGNFWDTVNIENIMQSITGNDENCICFNGKSIAEMVVAVELKDESSVTFMADKLLESLRDKNNTAITVVSSNELVKLNDIGVRLKALRTKLYVGIKLFESQIIWNDVEIISASADIKLLAETLKFAIKTGSNQLKKCLLMTITQLINSGMTQLQIVNFFDGLINDSEIANYQVIGNSSTLKMEIYSAISNAIDINSLTEDLTFLLSSIYVCEPEGKRDNNQLIAEKIEAYLKNNYKETITNSILSKKFGFVPSYITKIFRIYKGISPSEYLTNYRVEMSKKIMLGQPNILLKEVAERVGYNDQHYFSKIFKKETGLWPTEYRSRD